MADLTYRYGVLFVFSTPSRELLTYRPATETWGNSMELMGGSRISAQHDGKVYLVSDDTKRVVSYDLANDEFIQTSMPANSISYSRAYGIGVADLASAEPYSGATVVGVAANSDLWQFNLESGAFRFLPGRSVSGPPAPLPLQVTPNWERFDAVLIPPGSEISPGVVGEPFTEILSAAGGQSPYTWSIVDGELPTGLSLGSNGQFSGITSIPGFSIVKVEVTDADGSVAQANITVRMGGKVLSEPEIPIHNLEAPVISGSPNVGRTLVATYGTWDYSGAAYEVQWYRDGVAISGASDVEYLVTEEDVSAELTVAVTARVPGTETSDIAWSSSVIGEPKTEVILVVSKQSVYAGDSVIVTGSGFDPEMILNLELRSQPLILGEAITNADGGLSATVTIPEDTLPGPHTLVAVGPDGDLASVALSVLAVDGTDGDDNGSGDGSDNDAGLPVTGTNSAALLTVVGILLLAGLALVVARSRKFDGTAVR